MKIIVITRIIDPDNARLLERLFPKGEAIREFDITEPAISVVAVNGNSAAFRDDAVAQAFAEPGPDLAIVHFGGGGANIQSVVTALVPSANQEIIARLKAELNRCGISYSSPDNYRNAAVDGEEKAMGVIVALLAWCGAQSSPSLPPCAVSLLALLAGYVPGRPPRPGMPVLGFRARQVRSLLWAHPEINQCIDLLSDGADPGVDELRSRRHQINNTLMAVKLDLSTLQRHPDLKDEICRDWSSDDGNMRINGLIDDIGWVRDALHIADSAGYIARIKKLFNDFNTNCKDVDCTVLAAEIDELHRWLTAEMQAQGKGSAGGR